ncbi:PKD domain-containing protein [Halorubrum sp. FL23]|uniref:PKD domain-containing protein n=1 Tax=Halorubrum sp. FL23 TaxID=3458704 RepID=UPI004033CFD9
MSMLDGRVAGWGRRSFIKSLLLATLGTGTVTSGVNQRAQSTVSSTGWSTFARDPQNTGYNPDTAVPTELNPQWSRDVFTAGRLVGRGNRIYVSQLDGPIQARSASTGDIVWETEYSIYGTGPAPTVTSDTVYVAGYEDFYALSTTDGSTKWSTNISASGTATTVVDDLVFAGGRDGVVYALDASTGTQQWTFDTGDDNSGSDTGAGTPRKFDGVPEPAFANGTVYIGGGYDNSKVYALSATDGTVQWEVSLSAAVMAPPTVSSGTVYVNSTDGRVHALNTDDGSEVWTYKTTNITYASPSVANGTVVVGSLDQTLYALDASDGTELWSVDLGNAIGVSPVIADGSILVQFTDGSVTVRSLADGTEQNAASTASGDSFSDVLNNIIVFNGEVFTHKHGSLRKFSENTPPTASISIEPKPPNQGEEVTLSAEPSSAGDGTIQSYSWDLNGNGEFDQTGKVQTKTYNSDETQVIYLRIIDSAGAQAYAQGVVRVQSVDQPPTASFTISPSNPTPDETITLDGSGSSDDGSITKYRWNLDDDETFEKTGSSIQTSFSSSGEMPVTLRVTDDAGNTDSVVKDVSVSANAETPTADFDYFPQNPASGETVTFDASPSTADTTITSYDWDVTGDGNYDEQGETITQSFEMGEVEVTLRITDDMGQTDTVSRTVSVGSSDAPPTAAFDFSPASPTAGQSISFDASASTDDGTVDSYEWDFNDDGTMEKSGEQTSYTFETSGEYPVTLRVTDDAGQSSTSKRTVSVSRENAPPTASFTYTPSNPTTADEIEFDASSSSDDEGISAYEWDFTGDNSTDSTGQTATYGFETATEHEVTLTVRDGDGITRSTSQTVTVTESPFQQMKAAHLSTAREVQDATVSDLGVVDEAQTANQEYTEAVEAGSIDSNTAFKAIQRLDTGIETTATVAEQIGSAPELGGSNETDLTRKMTKPTIDTAVQLATMIATASSQSSGGGSLIGAIKKDLIQGIKSDAKTAIKNLIRSMLGDTLTKFTSNLKSKGDTLASEIISGALSTATEIKNRLEELKNEILGLIADALQRRAEGGFSFKPAPLLATDLAAYAGTLDAGIDGLYTFLRAETVSENGLFGTTDDALAETNDQREEIRSQVESAEDIIDDAIEFGNNSNLASTLAGFSDGIGIIDILRGISTVVGYFISGIPSAFATGAGIGSLIEINIRHHVSMYTAIQGDSL